MASMVIRFRKELKGVVVAAQELVQRLEKALEAAEGGMSMDYAALEREVAASCGAIERASHRALLQALDIDAPEVEIEGALYGRTNRCEAPYYTLAGEVRVTRSLYRRRGDHNGPTVDPVSLRAGVVGEGWLPETAKAMSYLVQKEPSREAEKTAEQLGRLPYSRSSFERVGHDVGRQVVAEHNRVNETLIQGLVVPSEARSVSVSLDRISVPMEEPKKRPPGRPRKGAPKKPVEVAYRMAYTATVTLHDDEGEALHTVRYGRMPQGDADDLCGEVSGDVQAMLAKRPDLKVVALVDGAPEMANRLRAHVNEQELGRTVVELVDFWHLIEKLAAAAAVIHRVNADEALRRWKLSLLNRSRAAREILEELRHSGKERVRVGKEQPVHEAITYLANNHDRMDYAAARRKGLPIGSGNVEATGKSLFALRLKRPGARWRNDTGEHVVQLRALALSDRWSAAIELTLRPLRKSVKVAA